MNEQALAMAWDSVLPKLQKGQWDPEVASEIRSLLNEDVRKKDVDTICLWLASCWESSAEFVLNLFTNVTTSQAIAVASYAVRDAETAGCLESDQAEMAARRSLQVVLDRHEANPFVATMLVAIRRHIRDILAHLSGMGRMCDISDEWSSVDSRLRHEARSRWFLVSTTLENEMTTPGLLDDVVKLTKIDALDSSYYEVAFPGMRTSVPSWAWEHIASSFVRSLAAKTEQKEMILLSLCGCQQQVRQKSRATVETCIKQYEARAAHLTDEKERKMAGCHLLDQLRDISNTSVGDHLANAIVGRPLNDPFGVSFCQPFVSEQRVTASRKHQATSLGAGKPRQHVGARSDVLSHAG